MKNKMTEKIGIDLDDVLVDFNGALRRWHNDIYKTSLKLEDFKSYFFNETWGGTIQETIDKVGLFNHSRYYETISPIEGAVWAINSLLKIGKEPNIVTSRADFLRESTEKMLKFYFKKQSMNIFYSSNHYSGRENSGKTKPEICLDNKIPLIIDDSLEYAMQCAEKGIRVLLFGDYPWNQNGNLPANVVRVKNWKEVLEKLT
jgi:uncharacterized HAD superfamily protein